MCKRLLNAPLVLCFFLTITALAFNASAQGNGGQAMASDWIYDPLKRPDVWKELIKTPLDSGKWVEYCGKNWKDMTLREMEKINHWKQQLMLKQLTSNESIIGFVIKPEFRSADFFIDELAFTEMLETIEKVKNAGKKDGKNRVVRAQFAGMEAVILQENEELKQLKTNPRANFAMIETLYEEIFREFNIKYTYYHEKHPDNKYPILKWVEDQETALRELKMKQVDEMKKKYAQQN